MTTGDEHSAVRFLALPFSIRHDVSRFGFDFHSLRWH